MSLSLSKSVQIPGLNDALSSVWNYSQSSRPLLDCLSYEVENQETSHVQKVSRVADRIFDYLKEAKGPTTSDFPLIEDFSLFAEKILYEKSLRPEKELGKETVNLLRSIARKACTIWNLGHALQKGYHPTMLYFRSENALDFHGCAFFSQVPGIRNIALEKAKKALLDSGTPPKIVDFYEKSYGSTRDLFTLLGEKGFVISQDTPLNKEVTEALASLWEVDLNPSETPLNLVERISYINSSEERKQLRPLVEKMTSALSVRSLLSGGLFLHSDLSQFESRIRNIFDTVSPNGKEMGDLDLLLIQSLWRRNHLINNLQIPQFNYTPKISRDQVKKHLWAAYESGCPPLFNHSLKNVINEIKSRRLIKKINPEILEEFPPGTVILKKKNRFILSHKQILDDVTLQILHLASDKSRIYLKAPKGIHLKIFKGLIFGTFDELVSVSPFRHTRSTGLAQEQVFEQMMIEQERQEVASSLIDALEVLDSLNVPYYSQVYERARSWIQFSPVTWLPLSCKQQVLNWKDRKTEVFIPQIQGPDDLALLNREYIQTHCPSILNQTPEQQEDDLSQILLYLVLKYFSKSSFWIMAEAPSKQIHLTVEEFEEWTRFLEIWVMAERTWNCPTLKNDLEKIYQCAWEKTFQGMENALIRTEKSQASKNDGDWIISSLRFMKNYISLFKGNKIDKKYLYSVLLKLNRVLEKIEKNSPLDVYEINTQRDQLFKVMENYKVPFPSLS